MKSLKLKVEFEGHKIVTAEGNNMKDFDNIMKDLKTKFDGKRNK